MKSIGNHFKDFARLYGNRVPPHELIAAKDMPTFQMKNWLDAKILFFNSEEKQKTEALLNPTLEEINQDKVLRQTVLENDAIAKGIWQAYQKGGLELVHSHLSEAAKFIQDIDLINHAFERYLKFRCHVDA